MAMSYMSYMSYMSDRGQQELTGKTKRIYEQSKMSRFFRVHLAFESMSVLAMQSAQVPHPDLSHAASNLSPTGPESALSLTWMCEP